MPTTSENTSLLLFNQDASTTSKNQDNNKINKNNEQHQYQQQNIDDNNDDKNEIQNNNYKDNWHRTTAALSFSFLVQSYLIVSVLPYEGFMAMYLIPHLNTETVGSYAGIITSSFMIGRIFSSFGWGVMADRYGRVFVLKLSLLLSAILSLCFGLSPTYPIALFVRGLLGLSNGINSSVKTLVSEYCCGDQKKETQMMTIVIGMLGYGFLISPAIAGYLSDPIKQYPNIMDIVTTDEDDNNNYYLLHLMKMFLYPLFKKNPFFLPNLVGCFFCLIAYGLVHNFVAETLFKEKQEHFQWQSLGLSTNQLNLAKEEVEDIIEVVQVQDSMPNNSHADEDGNDIDDKEIVTIRSMMDRTSTRQHLLVHWFSSFLGVTADVIFPLYCMSNISGLGITEKTIGNLYTGGGLFFFAVQYFLVTGLVERYGVYSALKIGMIFSTTFVCLIPLSLITNHNYNSTTNTDDDDDDDVLSKKEGGKTLTLSSLLFLSIVPAIIKVSTSVVTSTITMTTNRTVPPNQRATMNGVSALGGSLVKGIGPLFGGLLFSTSINHITPPYGSVFAYSVMSVLGILVCVQTFILPEYNNKNKKKTTK